MQKFVAGMAAVAIVTFGTAAFAQRHGGGGGGGAPQRAAAPARPVSAAPARGGGFQLDHDLTPARPTAPQQRPAVSQQRPAPVVRPVAPVMPQQRVAPVQHAAVQQHTVVQQRTTTTVRSRVAVRENPTHRPSGHGRRIANPSFHGGSWGWNHGVAWNAAPTYWGGGFWGALAIDDGAASFGDIVAADETYDSYAVYQDSPGATLLSNYQLTQTPCGPPDLVVIWGPDNSLICAFPNDVVAAGEYDVDPTTLTLESE